MLAPTVTSSAIVSWLRMKRGNGLSCSFSLRLAVSTLAVFAISTVSDLGLMNSGVASAQTTGSIQRGPSGLPLPRFVSLKSSRVNMRIGPGRDYAVDWLYLKSGLPLEVIQEYDNWRRVRDSEGTEGWIYQSLLSGRRMGMAAPWHQGKKASVDLRREPEDGAGTLALVEPGAIGRVHLCNGDWCQMTFKGHKGWIKQPLIWGVYPGETYDD